ADLSQVVIKADGASGLQVAPDGSLLVQTSAGPLRQTAPVTWEVLPSGQKQAVGSHFRIIDAQHFGFTAPGHDPSRPLVVDPGLDWSRFRGGRKGGKINGRPLTKAGSGALVVVGNPWSPDFPATTGSLVPPMPLASFVARLSAGGTGLVYATLFGSATGWTQFPHAVALDGSGAPVVVGETNAPDFPTTPGAFDRALSGSTDAFVTKFDKNGTNLVFSTYLGGNVEQDPNSAFYQ